MGTFRWLLLCGCLSGLGIELAAAGNPDGGAPAELVRVRATADLWLSDGNPRQRNSNAGKSPQLKLRNIRDLALIRFDTRAIQGREILDASLFLHRIGNDSLRYLRVSTVNQDWEEGRGETPDRPADGATFTSADAKPGVERPWAWPGSSVADVIMSAGNSVGCWAERKDLSGGWISIALSPQVIYALAIGDSDGLAVMDGGNPADQENVFSSCQVEGYEPYLEVSLGAPLTAVPAQPAVTAEPAPERAHLRSGAIRVAIEPAENVSCWRVQLDGQPVARWRIKHPPRGKPAIFFLEDLPPQRDHELDIVAVSPGGRVSPTARLKVRSSKALSLDLALGVIEPPPAAEAAPLEDRVLRVWPLPGLVKIDPETTEVLCDDLGAAGPGPARPDALANAVWNGKKVHLFGARGEYVSFQLCLEHLGQERLCSVQVRPQPLYGPGDAKIGADNVELYQNWYARNLLGQWQPAYCVPIKPQTSMSIPDRTGRIPQQRNQTVYVDVYVPKHAKPGTYAGSVVVTAEPDLELEVPVSLEVLNLTLPDRLSFWPELNAYRIPDRSLEYYRLAHRHRLVLNCWAWRPQVSGSGRTIRVHWDEYDRCAGPLLSGEAFADGRRGGVPVECMYLPFEDSWPTPLSKKSYRYRGYWPKKGDDPGRIVEHYLTAPPIDQALSEEYREAIVAVQRQFIEHFGDKGYTQTEMQYFLGGKVTNRVHFGTNTWWTTDEPYYWDDWLALQYVLQLWAAGRGSADPRVWAARADISRPQWQGRSLGGLVDAAYFGAGGFGNPAMVRRCRILGQDTGLNVRAYGSASQDGLSNTENVTMLLSAWADGADAFLAWQTLGSEASLEQNDAGSAGGNALLVPGVRFGQAVVGDIRLKAFRDGQQLIEYLTLLSERYRLTREQVKTMVHEATRPQSDSSRARPIDDADAIRLAGLSAWHVQQLRRRVADLLVR